MNKVLVVWTSTCLDDFENPGVSLLLFTEDELKEYVSLLTKEQEKTITEDESEYFYNNLIDDHHLEAAEFKNFNRIVTVISYYGSHVEYTIEDYCKIDHPIATAD